MLYLRESPRGANSARRGAPKDCDDILALLAACGRGHPKAREYEQQTRDIRS
jgi:hypothetical protein